MFDIVDTPFSYGRGLIVCSLLQKFSKTKRSALHVTWNVVLRFYFVGQMLLPEYWLDFVLLQFFYSRSVINLTISFCCESFVHGRVVEESLNLLGSWGSESLARARGWVYWQTVWIHVATVCTKKCIQWYFYNHCRWLGLVRRRGGAVRIGEASYNKQLPAIRFMIIRT